MEAIATQMLDPKVAAQAAASPVLDVDVHLPILRRWGVGMAQRANVPEHFLYSSVADYCSGRAVAYMKKQKQHMQKQQGGYVLKRAQVSATDRCASMVAASFRQMRTGRVILLQDLLGMLKRDEVPDIAMIAVPDFFSEKTTALSDYEHKLVMHFLNSQYLGCKATVLYVSSMKDLRKTYGEQVYEHLATSYHIE